MIFDNNGLPKDNGASDYMDSSRLAGLNELFGSQYVDLMKYIKYSEEGEIVAVRHPIEVPSNNWKNFTRDQLVCLVSGLAKQGEQGTVFKLYMLAKDRGNRAQNTEADFPGTLKRFPNGADLLSPSAMGHLRRCAGLKATWFQDLWLKIDILYRGLFSPLSEPNQLICMCVSAGAQYIKMFKKYNKQWQQSIREYWCGWRDEPELAEQMIAVLEKY